MKPVLQRVMLGYLAATSVVVGLWAQFGPRSFYDHFPGFGHIWVGVDGPFNEHLTRDVGGLNLALGAILLLAAVSLQRSLVLAACVASLLYGIPHVIYHLANRGSLDTGDFVAVSGGLALFALLPFALVLTRAAAID
jgi:hypothetical protein